MKSRGAVNLHLVLTIFLGIGMVLFGVLAVLAYRDNESVHQNLNTIVKRAKTEAAAQQKQEDDLANQKLNESPYRTYTADPVHGGFQLQVPKNWSIYAGKSVASPTVLDLAINPDVVNMNLGQGAINTQAFHLQLQDRKLVEVIKTYNERAKQGKVKSKGTTVSGIPASWFEGTIDDQRHQGVVVVLPVRDKTMIISAENRAYLEQFNTILGSAKVNP